MSTSGTVKFFNDQKGFGFITPADGGEDLFVHANDCTDGNQLMDGDAVYYDASYDDRKGKTKASNVTGGTGGARQQGGGGYGGGKGGGGYGGGGGVSGGNTSNAGSSGTVKFFNNMKGFGFITPADGGEDLFVHANDCTDGRQLMDGDEVYYDSAYDEKKGKTKASNVSGGSGGERQQGGGKGGGYGGGKGSYGGGYGGGY